MNVDGNPYWYIPVCNRPYHNYFLFAAQFVAAKSLQLLRTLLHLHRLLKRIIPSVANVEKLVEVYSVLFSLFNSDCCR